MTAMANVQFAVYIMSIYGRRFSLPAEFAAVIDFEWDRGNSMKNEKHSVSDEEAEQVFFNEPLLVLDDSAHRASESRWHALGHTNEHRLLQVTFTVRANSTRVRIISARPMHRKERKAYAQATQTNP
jgi:uncharacterized DUF497 family protein